MIVAIVSTVSLRVTKMQPIPPRRFAGSGQAFAEGAGAHGHEGGAGL